MEPEIAEPRVKRLKKDKFGRFAALKRLKDLKGSKHKCEIDDVDNVYDTVDENEYANKVMDRQEDWIVDDDGSGYIEDGRDVFDDDIDSESIAKATKGKGAKRKKKAVSDNAGKGNLQFMLSNMPSKKKEEVKLEEDELLSELISEIDNPSTSNLGQTSSLKPKPMSSFSFIEDKKAVRDYMRSFNAVKPKYIPIKLETDEEIIIPDEPEVLKEITENETIVPKIAIKPKAKLLFQVQEPKVKIKTEEEILLENDFDFGEDFDLSEFDSTPKPTEVIKEDDLSKFASQITEEQLIEGWQTCSMVKPGLQSVDLDDVPMTTDNDDENVFRFYWWDAYEEPATRPGVVLLFGKTFNEKNKQFVSCCVTVTNIPRKIYLLPRINNTTTGEPIKMMDVYQEFNNTVANEMKFKTFKSRKVTKNFAFDPTVPTESEYLEVMYDASFPKIEDTLEGETFSRVFGTHSSFLETFLLDSKIKGSCWLDVTGFTLVANPLSYCKMEISCGKPENVSAMKITKPVAPPPLVVVAINIKTAINIKQSGNEIVMISCLINKNYAIDKQAPNPPFQHHFCIFTKLADTILPSDLNKSLAHYKATKVSKMESERVLLSYFIANFTQADPDLIVGHDLTGYQINILCDRLNRLGIQEFSRLSKIRRAFTSDRNKYMLQKMERTLFTGRLVCDIKISAKELIKSRSYDLDTLCKNVLKVPDGKRIDIEPENVPKMYATSSDILKMITLTMQDAAYILKIMYELMVIPLALQITNIAGNVMSRTLMGGRSERNEFLLLHAFYEKDYIVPEKFIKNRTDQSSTAVRKKPTFSGGLVLDPKAGFYDKLILLMDFNSLYPSIIQEYNICFTTISSEVNFDNIILPDRNISAGILPTEIRKLVESRREVKKLMNSPDISNDLRMQYQIRQMALKLTANSMYGCLGFKNSRFFQQNLAALITYKGREILTNTKDLVQKLSYDVIYGDTDSIMINTNSLDYEAVFKIGKMIKQEVNKMYKQVELDIDGVFKYLLLLKKKKYAAVLLAKNKNGDLIETQEHKGLDIVRRDWSQLACEAGRFILDHILSEQGADERIENIHNYLVKLKNDVDANKVPLSLFVITKQLTKEPNMYPDKNSLPHVQVALRHNRKGGKKFRAGDTVPYIICQDGTNKSATQRAYLIEEFKSSETLALDTKYYLEQQIHPVIMRICEPLDGTDSYQIANCLGLEGTSFKNKISNKIENNLHGNYKSREERFRNVESFKFKCIACNTINEISPDNIAYAMDKCKNIECMVRPCEYISNIKNQLVLQMRSLIKKYYQFEMTCEDPSCSNNTNRLPQYFIGKHPHCRTCKKGIIYKVVREVDLYMQLDYYLHIFDYTKHKKKLTIDPAMESAYNVLKETVENTLKHSDYRIVHLGALLQIVDLNHQRKMDIEQINEGQEKKNASNEIIDSFNVSDREEDEDESDN